MGKKGDLAVIKGGRGGRVAGFIAAATGTALVCALWAGIASAANGSLEICKSGLNGAAGQTFKVAYQKGSTGTPTTVSVTGGSCNAAISVPIGTYILTEDLSSGQWVMSGDNVTPSSAWVADSVKRGMVKVTVVANAETQVEFVNQPAGSTIKVCKWSSSPALQNAQYSFNVGGTTVTATAGKTAATAGCSTAVATFPGTKIKITEAVPSGETVAGVTFNGAAVTPPSASFTVKATTGANVVVIQDEPTGPPQTGYLEICKDPGDQFVEYAKDPFVFTVTDRTNASQQVSVLVNQCSGPIKVAAGNVNVAESVPANELVSKIFTQPDPNALGPTNLPNGTATVVVPVSADSTGEVQVHFVNSTVTATLKICKYLTSTSGQLNGVPFSFTVKDDAGQQELTIIASKQANGACKIVTEEGGDDNNPSQEWFVSGDGLLHLPVGSTVTVTEAPMAYVSADGQPVGTGETQTVTVVGGINTISFTNQAYGQLEICKQMLKNSSVDDTIYNGVTFFFSLDGSKTLIPVAAGHCSMPQIVPAGTHTVREPAFGKDWDDNWESEQLNPYGFQFVSSNATGPMGDNRCVPQDLSATPNCGNPITVSVPWFKDPSNGGETLITFTNKVLRASFKICKQIDPGSVDELGGLNYTFKVKYLTTTPPFFFQFNTTVFPPYPSCTGLLPPTGPIPVVLPNPLKPGTLIPNIVTITETLPKGADNPDILVNNGLGLQFPGSGTVLFIPGPGVVVVTYTNKAKPVPVQQP
jgi:hypothetical protein